VLKSSKDVVEATNAWVLPSTRQILSIQSLQGCTGSSKGLEQPELLPDAACPPQLICHWEDASCVCHILDQIPVRFVPLRIWQRSPCRLDNNSSRD
jgi:hypothetical protein